MEHIIKPCAICKKMVRKRVRTHLFPCVHYFHYACILPILLADYRSQNQGQQSSNPPCQIKCPTCENSIKHIQLETSSVTTPIHYIFHPLPPSQIPTGSHSTWFAKNIEPIFWIGSTARCVRRKDDYIDAIVRLLKRYLNWSHTGGRQEYHLS